MDFSLTEQLIFVIGGLGIFLFGISIMGDCLKSLAGNKMKLIIEKTTNTPLKGILVGTVVTTLLQSSSGTTALTIGLVRAGLMTFPQAIGVILGANIGTTVTSFLIGLNISEYSLLFVGVGAILMFFFKKKKVQNIGGVLLGFGMLFFGLELMGDALKVILNQYNEQANSLFTQFSKYPILGLGVGALLTAVIQSSSAAIGILQKLYESGSISLSGSLPILLGANIGTTITAIFASIGGTIAAKRTAVVHTLFNVIGALLFMLILNFAFVPLMDFIESKFLITDTNESPAMTIAIAHMIFNLGSTFVLFFFIKQMSAIAMKIFPEKDSDDTLIKQLNDYTLIEQSPTLALELASKAIDKMGDLTTSYYELTKKYTFKSSEITEKADEFERNINSLDKNIHDYLLQITSKDIDSNETNLLSKHLDTIKDLERIGDHCSNIVEFFAIRYENNEILSDDAIEDLNKMYSLIDQIIDCSIKSYTSFDKEKALLVAELEEKVDKYEEKYRKKHVQRINKGTCKYNGSERFVDVLSNLERIADHGNNIATNIITDDYFELDEFNH